MMISAAPLTPTDCDLQDFAYMPLDVRRLRDSDLAALESPEACWSAVLLWSASWHQVPAASLPDDDRVLANLAGFGRVVKEWQRVREGALRGWVKCSDGRLYHPVVAEKAIEAWESKLRHSYGKLCERIRKENKRRESEGRNSVATPTFEQWKDAGRPAENFGAGAELPLETPPSSAGIPTESVTRSAGKEQLSAVTPTSSAGIPPENALKGKGEGEGKGLGKPLPPAPSETTPPEILPAVADAPTAPKKPAVETALQAACRATWSAYSDAYRDRYGEPPIRTAKLSSQVKMLVQNLGREEAPLVAAWFVSHPGGFYVQKGHDIGLLLTDVVKLRTEWATGRVITATAARQSDRRGAMSAAVSNLLAECGDEA